MFQPRVNEAQSVRRPRAVNAISSRAAVTAALLLALVAPATAMAQRSPSDRVAGTALSEGKVPMSAAPDIDAAAGILVGPDGTILWSRRADTPRAMASTTKIMTAILVLENARLGEKVVVSSRASRTPYALGLKPGERASVGRLLELMLVASSNDAAVALAEHVGGTLPRFVRMMNARAKRLGLDETHFANPHGLDARGHYSSPGDLARLARLALSNPNFRRIVSKRRAYFPGYRGRPSRMVKTTDKLLGAYPGIRGVKTGFTDNAKYSFVGHAQRDGVGLTVVILGARSDSVRFAQTRRLMDWGFRNVRRRSLTKPGLVLEKVPVADAAQVEIPVRAGEDVSRIVFRHGGSITDKVTLSKPVKLPVLEGQRLGSVDIVQSGKVLASVPAVAATSTLTAEKVVGSVPVSDYLDRRVPARVQVGPVKLRDFDPSKPVEESVRLEKNVTAPVKTGERLGEVAYLQGDQVIARLPVVASEAVDEPGIFETVRVSVARAWLGMLGGSQPVGIGGSDS